MNHLVQRGKVRSQVITVPEGLPEILADITREVLRCQPTTECLCQFIVDYLHSVIESRQKAKLSREIIEKSLKMVEHIIEDICLCSMEQAKAKEMSMAMEDCFRRFLEQRRCEERSGREIIRFHEKDMLDEIRERCRFTEQELKTNKADIDHAYRRFVSAYMVASEEIDGSEALYQYFKERDDKRKEELKQQAAAIRIQSNFRGYIVRKTVPKPPRKSVDSDDKNQHILTVTQDILDMDVNDPELNAAATKIQQFFKQLVLRPSERSEKSIVYLEPEEISTVPAAQETETVTATPAEAVLAPAAEVVEAKVEHVEEAPVVEEPPVPVEEPVVEVKAEPEEVAAEPVAEPPAPQEEAAAPVVEPEAPAAEPAQPAEEPPAAEVAVEAVAEGAEEKAEPAEEAAPAAE